MRSKKTLKWMALIALVLVLGLASTGTADEPDAAQPEAISCGDSISCTMATAAVRVVNTGTGAAFYGENGAHKAGIKGRGQPGVQGYSWGGTGVSAESTNGIGLKAKSDSGWGAFIQAGSNTTPDLVLGGTSGSNDDGSIWSNPDATASDLLFYSMDNAHLHLDQDNNNTSSFVIKNGGDDVVFAVDEDGYVNVAEDIEVEHNNGLTSASSTGSAITNVANGYIYNWVDNDDNGTGCFYIKAGGNYTLAYWCESKGAMVSGPSAMAVETSSGPREMYGLGSTGLWFEDFGSAALVDGQVTVTMDPLFLETVNSDDAYHVFLTPLGDCNGLYVTDKTPASFEVHELGGGSSNVAFDYRIVAKRLGYETQRLEPADLNPSGE